jgi:hypothetical protein
VFGFCYGLNDAHFSFSVGHVWCPLGLPSVF